MGRNVRSVAYFTVQNDALAMCMCSVQCASNRFACSLSPRGGKPDCSSSSPTAVACPSPAHRLHTFFTTPIHLFTPNMLITTENWRTRQQQIGVPEYSLIPVPDTRVCRSNERPGMATGSTDESEFYSGTGSGGGGGDRRADQHRGPWRTGTQGERSDPDNEGEGSATRQPFALHPDRFLNSRRGCLLVPFHADIGHSPPKQAKQ